MDLGVARKEAKSVKWRGIEKFQKQRGSDELVIYSRVVYSNEK